MSTMTSKRKLTLNDILDHRAYERVREEMRAQVIEVKRRRRMHLGTIVTVSFENRLTMQSQIQEMLRVERVVTDDGVMGPVTLQALTTCNPALFRARFNGARLQFMTGLAGWSSFSKGWARRVAENLLR